MDLSVRGLSRGRNCGSVLRHHHVERVGLFGHNINKQNLLLESQGDGIGSRARVSLDVRGVRLFVIHFETKFRHRLDHDSLLAYHRAEILRQFVFTLNDDRSRHGTGRRRDRREHDPALGERRAGDGNLPLNRRSRGSRLPTTSEEASDGEREDGVKIALGVHGGMF